MGNTYGTTQNLANSLAFSVKTADFSLQYPESSNINSSNSQDLKEKSIKIGSLSQCPITDNPPESSSNVSIKTNMNNYEFLCLKLSQKYDYIISLEPYILIFISFSF